MSSYIESIRKDTGEQDPEVLKAIEMHMRSDIVHSTLDWLTRPQFKNAARKAYQLYVAINIKKATDEQIIRAFNKATAADVHLWRANLMKAAEQNGDE